MVHLMGREIRYLSVLSMPVMNLLSANDIRLLYFQDCSSDFPFLCSTPLIMDRTHQVHESFVHPHLGYYINFILEC